MNDNKSKKKCSQGGRAKTKMFVLEQKYETNVYYNKYIFMLSRLK